MDSEPEPPRLEPSRSALRELEDILNDINIAHTKGQQWEYRSVKHDHVLVLIETLKEEHSVSPGPSP